MFVLRAAGFIATSTFGASPGVRMSWSAKWTWKPETPGREPAGARISAGKSGKVERSLPSRAVSLVNRPPVSCMPSPESPAKRTMTLSSCSTGLASLAIAVGIARCREARLFGGVSNDFQPPGAAAFEELIRIDIVAPPEKVRLRILLGRAEDSQPRLRFFGGWATLELLETALGLLGRGAFHVPTWHSPTLPVSFSGTAGIPIAWRSAETPRGRPRRFRSAF